MNANSNLKTLRSTQLGEKNLSNDFHFKHIPLKLPGFTELSVFKPQVELIKDRTQQRSSSTKIELSQNGNDDKENDTFNVDPRDQTDMWDGKKMFQQKHLFKHTALHLYFVLSLSLFLFFLSLSFYFPVSFSLSISLSLFLSPLLLFFSRTHAHTFFLNPSYT